MYEYDTEEYEAEDDGPEPSAADLKLAARHMDAQLSLKKAKYLLRVAQFEGQPDLAPLQRELHKAQSRLDALDVPYQAMCERLAIDMTNEKILYS